MQDNHSRSTRGVVRGMHFQVGDGRRASSCAAPAGASSTSPSTCAAARPTYGQWEGVELDDESMRELYVPVGFAHGFCVLSDVADVLYKQSAYYDPAVERGIAWDDPDVAIEWPLPADELIVSERDAAAPATARGRGRAAVRVASLEAMSGPSAALCASAPTATRSPLRSIVRFAYVALVALTLIVLHRRRGAADGLRPRLPDVAASATATSTRR